MLHDIVTWVFTVEPFGAMWIATALVGIAILAAVSLRLDRGQRLAVGYLAELRQLVFIGDLPAAIRLASTVRHLWIARLATAGLHVAHSDRDGDPRTRMAFVRAALFYHARRGVLAGW